jgi:segregation and condensation protein B
MRSNPVYADYVQKLLALRPVRLSRAQLETLAIIAYRQPVTRPEVDDIRGVDSGPVLKGLLERDLIKIVGKKDEVGRPMLYGTAPTFLELFSLESLNDLPSLKEFTELSDESRDLFVQKTGEQAPEGALDRELPDDVERDLAPHDEAPAEPQAGEASETEAQQETEPEPAEPQETEPEADEQPSIAADAVDDAVDDAPGDNLEADEDDDEADETEADEADETDDGSMDDEDADDAPDSDDEVPSEDEPPALDASDSEDDALDEPPDSSALASQPGFDPESAREVSEPPEPDPNDEA